MSKNTVKPALTPTPRTKRSKREVENREFDAFVRRILRAYARRVAAGDVEALASLTALSAEVDAVTRGRVPGAV
jgi:ribosomal protein S20